jgi:hypothetical protein
MTKKETLATRIEPAYIDILEIMAKREGMTISELIRNLLVTIINKEFETEKQFEGEPSEFYFKQAHDWLNSGLAKLAAEKGKNTLDTNPS